MFRKNKWLVVIAVALLFMACDLISGNPGSGDQNGGTDTIPSTPANVRAVAVSSTSISITWNSVSGVTSYDVYYETGSQPITMLSTVPGTSYTHTGLQPNTAYNYYITAKNSAGASNYSSRASATTQAQ